MSAGLGWLLLVVLAVLIEVFLLVTRRESLSRWVWRHTPLNPWIAFLAGFLAGHFFAPSADFLRSLL